MFASSRQRGDNFSVTGDKTGNAGLLVGTELDVRTIFTFTWTNPDVVARMTLIQWSNSSTEAVCACLSCRVIAGLEYSQFAQKKIPFA